MRALERPQGVGLPAFEVQRGDEKLPQALAQWVLVQQRLDGGHDRAVLADRQPGRDPVLARSRPTLVEGDGLGAERGLIREVGKCWAAPQRQPVSEQRGPFGGTRWRRRGGAVDERDEPPRVHVVGVDVEHVATRSTFDALAADRAPQVGDVRLQRAAGRVRRRAIPHGLDQPLRGDDGPRPQQQVGQHRPLLGAADGPQPSHPGHLDRAEDAKVDPLAVHRRLRLRAHHAAVTPSGHALLAHPSTGRLEHSRNGALASVWRSGCAARG